MSGRPPAVRVEPDATGPAAPPRSNGELVFEEPWQARAFAMCVSLLERDGLGWDAFRPHLVRAIGEDPQAPYYASLVTALEAFAADRVAQPDPERLRAACRRHGFAAERIAPMAATGLANWVFALDGAHVLRVSRPTPMAEADARTEAVAVPTALAAGIRTPRLHVFDDSRIDLDTPFTVYDRVPGTPIGATSLDAATTAAVHRELGREMAAIHTRVTRCDDPRGWLDHPEPSDPGHDLDATLRSGALDPGEARWAEALLDRLTPALGAEAPRRFLHGDLLPMNILVAAGGAFAAVIDWGDAGWGDPALDFWGIPPEHTDEVIRGYGEVAELDEATVDRARAEQLCRALRHFVEPQRHPAGPVLLAALRRTLP